MIRSPCGQVGHVVCDEDDGGFFDDDDDDDGSSSDDDDDDDDSSTESSDNSITKAPAVLSVVSSRSSVRSAGSAQRKKVALKAPGSFPSISPAASSVAESKDSEQSGTKERNFIQMFIQEMTEDGVMLIWHGNSTAFQRPRGVVARLNLGSPSGSEEDGGTHEPPRLAWNNNNKQDGSNDDDDGENKNCVDLFDIRSLDAAAAATSSSDLLEDFPFAIFENCLVLVLQNGSRIVFEAGSSASARRFVLGLRWVVARLCFNLIVGNPLVSCELLSLGGADNVSAAACPATMDEEALWSKAMNDVTNRLVDGMLITKE
jgi:hypothetical protein